MIPPTFVPLRLAFRGPDVHAPHRALPTAYLQDALRLAHIIPTPLRPTLGPLVERFPDRLPATVLTLSVPPHVLRTFRAFAPRASTSATFFVITL